MWYKGRKRGYRNDTSLISLWYSCHLGWVSKFSAFDVQNLMKGSKIDERNIK
jgi:hypothetical protein